jgi:hypothetical protein
MVGWANTVLLGELAIGLSVIGIATIGFALLTGRLPLRLGGRVVLGLFVLLGAPAIATAFSGAWQASNDAPLPIALAPIEEPRADLPPANYDPYAGASLRRD